VKVGSKVLALGAIVPGMLVCSASAQFPTVPRAAKLSWAIDGRAPIATTVTAITLPNGNLRYLATVHTDQGPTLFVDYIVDPTNDPKASINGKFECHNLTPSEHTIDAKFVVPVCPVFEGGTLLGGSVALLATTDAGGGGIWCIRGTPSVWEAIISEQSAHTLFYCPFQMTTTGAGTMQSNAVFGAPIPGLPGPTAAANIGSRNRFTIGAGDKVKFTSLIVVQSLGVPNGCSADITGDGVVDAADLAMLLGAWGSTADPCSLVDLDHDGTIDAKDVAIVLGQWGPCAG